MDHGARALDEFRDFRHLLGKVFHFHIQRLARFAAHNHFFERIERNINHQSCHHSARDKARDEAAKEQEAIENGATDWKEAMKQWEEYQNNGID